MVYLLKMVIFHGKLLNNQMVNELFRYNKYCCSDGSKQWRLIIPELYPKVTVDPFNLVGTTGPFWFVPSRFWWSTAIGASSGQAQGLGSRSPGGWYLRGFSFQVSNDWNRIGVTVTMQFPGWTFRLMILEFIQIRFSMVFGHGTLFWWKMANEMCKMPLTDEFPIGSGDFLQIASVPRFEILSPWYEIPAFYGSKCTVSSPAKAWFLEVFVLWTGEGTINWSPCWIQHWSEMSENRGHHFQPVSALSPASAGDSGLPKRLRLVTS